MSKQTTDVPPREIAAGTVIDGRYKIIRTLGHGGNGMVHEVEHVLTKRRLALKSLHDESGLGRLEQEARASSLMKNGRTARITDMGTHSPAGPYLVMELLEGQSLRARLDEAGQLPLELTANLVLQVCECLAEAHELGIIHRDLKPENVFLCASHWPGQYDVKVLDFGIVKIAGEGQIPKGSLTRTGSTVGTPYYMSLEQLRNASAVDARADIYSLGVVLYECLSGRKPFQAETIGDLVFALCSAPPTPLGRLRPDLPAEVCELVMQTLSVSREDRPASMADLARALLPYGNAAFGLWIPVDTRQASGPAPSAAATDTRVAAEVVDPASPSPGLDKPSPTPTQAPRPGLMGAVPRPSPRAEPRSADVPVGDAVSAEAPARPQRPPMDSEPPGRRDTPTEMFVKAAHTPGDFVVRTGDRDTPTRAFSADGPEQFDERSFLRTLKSLGAPPPSAATASGTPAPRFGGPLVVTEAPSSYWADGALNDPPLPDTAVIDPRSFEGLHGTMKLSLQPNEPLPALPAAVLPALPTPPRAAGPAVASNPDWPPGLDGALTRFGRRLEDSPSRFRAASRPTQIAIVIAVTSAAVLFVSLIVLLLVRR